MMQNQQNQQKKRKATEAFGGQKPRLSAFAAAKAKQARSELEPEVGATDVSPPPDEGTSEIPFVVGTSQKRGIDALSRLVEATSLPTRVAATPYESQNTKGPEPGGSDDEVLNWNTHHGPNLTPSDPSTRLCSFRRSKDNLRSTENGFRLTLRPEESVTFLGHYDLLVRKGTILISGAMLRAAKKRHRVFSPSTHALLAIVAKGGSAEIEVSSPENQTLRDLDMLSPLFGKIWSEDRTDRSFQLIETPADDPLKRNLNVLHINDEVQKALNKMMNNPPAADVSSQAIMVVGPKHAGKSTFSRLLMNTLLTAPKAVARPTAFWLDLDPGQPEFSPSGQVTLVQWREPCFAPSYTHPATDSQIPWRTIRSHTLTAITPKDDPDHYVACSLDLITHYLRLQTDFPQAPLVINCSGWVVGSAITAMNTLIQQSPLSDLVLMQPVEPETVDLLGNAIPSATVWTMPMLPKRAQPRTSAELRAMQTMSYFHITQPMDGRVNWTSQPLSRMSPWKAKYTGRNVAFMAIMSYGEGINPEFLSTILNGMTVAIVVIESHAAFSQPESGNDARSSDSYQYSSPRTVQQSIRRTSRGLPYIGPDATGLVRPLDPRYSRCIGLALVRGIDVRNQELQLVTPIPSSTIRTLEGSKTVLVRGKFDCPDWAFLEDIHHRSTRRAAGEEEDGEENVERPYVAVRKSDAGLGSNVWRVRHQPRKSGGEATA